MQGYFRKIMIIDDDDVDRYILKKTVQQTALADEISEYSTGVEALQFITGSSGKINDLPDLIFLDINMPMLNGFEFLEVLEGLHNQLKNRCRVVVISSIEDEGDRARANQFESVIDYLLKPLSENSLLRLKDGMQYTQAS